MKLQGICKYSCHIHVLIYETGKMSGSGIWMMLNTAEYVRVNINESAVFKQSIWKCRLFWISFYFLYFKATETQINLFLQLVNCWNMSDICYLADFVFVWLLYSPSSSAVVSDSMERTTFFWILLAVSQNVWIKIANPLPLITASPAIFRVK
jgi:hypothetical protein